ncbi:MAG: hypothetical protein QOJ97_2298 [Solirubrobacteraceae bacterium]|nr:hypothetical protein [Solirubrobacteraceae bacterium]
MDGFFVAGVIAGEAHVSVVPNNGGQGWRCLFSLRMRADDTPLVRALRDFAATIIRCRDNIGHWPGAAEFFRWRLDNAPETPSHMTLYRCFPQGWQEALAAARRADGEADPEALRASGRTSAARV